jgi:hypothetical protein
LGAGVADVTAATRNEDALRRDQSAERPVTASTPTRSSVQIKMKLHDDQDRNITIRRMTDEEMSRNRSSSMSSSDGTETPSARRGYRRHSRVRPADDEDDDDDDGDDDDEGAAASAAITADPSFATPTPSTVQGAAPAGVGLRRPPPLMAANNDSNKDSAYYSAGPGTTGGLHPVGGTTVSSLATAESHLESSAMGSAADRRNRRRQERRRVDDSSASQTDNVEMFA